MVSLTRIGLNFDDNGDDHDDGRDVKLEISTSSITQLMLKALNRNE